MKQEDIPKLARFWNEAAQDFDSIYTEQKGPVRRALDSFLRKDMYQRFEWVMERAAAARPATVCDVGCGSGRFVTALASGGAGRVVGIDIAADMLQLARGLADAKKVESQCRFVHTDVLDWESSERFDLVIAIGLWDYIADPLPRLQRIRGITNGKFLSSWPRFWTWRMPIRKLRLTLKGCPVYFFRRPQVVRYLEQSGFRVRSCRVIGKLYCVEADPV